MICLHQRQRGVCTITKQMNDTLINALESRAKRARTLLVQGGVPDPKLIDEIITLRETLHTVNTYEAGLIESNMDID